MSGHSHWAGIKHKKGKADARKGRLFSRLAKQVISASRRGGKDPDTNLELQYAIEAAKAANMPKDVIERAILKGAGELEGRRLEMVRYEGYGNGGAAVMVDALTDNRSRTAANTRKIFDTYGGKLGASGCVSWMFQTKGLVILDLKGRAEEEVFDIAVEAGAEEFQRSGSFYELTCPVGAFKHVLDALRQSGIEWESAEITQVPLSYVDLSVDDGRKVLSLLEALEADEDITNVYSNFNLPRELVAEMDKE